MQIPSLAAAASAESPARAANKVTTRRRSRHRLCACAAAGAAPLLVAAQIALADRPQLQLRQFLQPFQWAMIQGYHSSGYDVVRIPSDLHASLLQVLDNRDDAISFGGEGERLEDLIIFGRSARYEIPPALQQRMRDEFHPILSRFCACELDKHATIGGGGIRLYRQGASLASHLDWAHKFVISATLNVKQADNRTRWPLHMRAFGPSTASHALTHAEGEAVLYEGSRMLHSRPVPLHDSYYAAAFVGFVPKRYPTGRHLLTRVFVGLVQRFG